MKRIDYLSVRAWTPGWLMLMAGLAVIVALAGAAVLYMEHQGHHVTGMTNQVVWGMPHVFAIFLIVAASGALNVASIGSVFGREPYQPLGRLSALLAMALLAGGLGVLVLDLGRPDRLIVAMTHFNFKSIFAWNVILYSGFFAVVGVYLWTMLDWKMKRAYKPAAITAFVWRLVLTTGTGSIFGFLLARDAYNSAVMAPLFIAMSFAFGLALFILFLLGSATALERSLSLDLLRRMGKLLALFAAANLYFVALQHGTALYMADRGPVEAFILMNGGIYTILFWGGQVLLGGIVPMALLFRQQATRCHIRFASLMVVAGGMAQVYVILIGGQAFPLGLFPGMEVSSSFMDGQVAAYAPTLAEILLGLGGCALALVITIVGISAFRILPAELGATEARE
ncbi:NrfD/PsrC family molybdoenzyme membrane anchor subunit [Magnetospirillum gryphiswaldense]|uniref:Molybdopterin oxidoreductase, membrane subunit n=2 Tax=Magnetospirillum gryphiswaldense TaxID=55518 RepID=V6F8U2_MAGGM|nr:NrfD/PsrC family molybdoenzyme membrane anchor subunit [Magnetospirillum gryphiswaldense]AVM74994.1 Polysulfide reductase, NrfD [Magnetospirillum gryphiswaldense MSR-1]AVM78897.1 Polysulfide reductase, NrfD [Magnetospirillum gryphiswaldense]CAM75797.1 Hdr-like menaquinol oxidoreductase subunit [Magnetospirillum gryphiswaldense MSR-1]CDL01116.1 Molybdopterin oxidoreductase, membrane subunit [Magnetospirillum gryphiswaldense MSR-1 v2]